MLPFSFPGARLAKTSWASSGASRRGERFSEGRVDFSLKYKPVENTVFREEEEGAFLFDPESGNLKYMNRSGRETYLMLDGRNDLEQVIRNLSDRYPDAESRQLKQDLEAFITDLERERFISRLHENAPARVV